MQSDTIQKDISSVLPAAHYIVVDAVNGTHDESFFFKDSIGAAINDEKLHLRTFIAVLGAVLLVVESWTRRIVADRRHGAADAADVDV